MEIAFWELLLAAAVVALGTVVQASIGFGLALVAAPLLVLINRALVPGPLIATGMVLVVWMAFRERQAIDFRNIAPALLGRLIGTLPAAWLMGTISGATFDLIFSVLVLLAVGISLVHGRITPRPLTIFFATIASGFMGTISSIGGPPVALVYQHARGANLRANLALLFMMGSAMSLAGLASVGRFSPVDLGYAAVMLLGVMAGIRLSAPLRRLMDRRKARPFLLGLCLISAGLVLSRALVEKL